MASEASRLEADHFKELVEVAITFKDLKNWFEKENIHTLELDSEMFLTLYSAFAQAESESTSQNVQMGMRAKMKRGEMNGIARIYGYVWNKETKELEINEEQAKIVRQVFDWYINGKGTQPIARLLNGQVVE